MERLAESSGAGPLRSDATTAETARSLPYPVFLVMEQRVTSVVIVAIATTIG
jgi:hypothetical protein